MEWNFDNVKYNGKDLDRVQIDGVTVWEKAKIKFYDYLQNTNGSAFINTGIIANDSTKIEFNAWSNYTGSFYFTGSRLSGQSKIYFAVGGKQANKDITLYAGDTEIALNLTRANTGFSFNGWLQTNGDSTLSYYLNYESTPFSDSNVPYSGSISYSIPIYIFSLDTSRTLSGTTKLYSYKIWQNGVLVRDFIPCEYNGQYGLWDKVENKFYGNANSSGAFTVGSEIKYYDYLLITEEGKPYIDTQLIPSNHCTIAVGYIDVQNHPLFGTDDGIKYYHICPYSNKWYYGTNGEEKSAGRFVNGKHSIKYNYGDDNQIIIDDVVIASNETIVGISNLLIGRRKEAVHGAGWKVYSFIVIDKSNNKEVRDYKPCLYNNQAGLWDLVECKFYGNANNTGTLTVGNDG